MNDRADDEDDRVTPENACPRCGEDHTDELEWLPDDSDEVRCHTCGTVYTPGTDPRPHIVEG